MDNNKNSVLYVHLPDYGWLKKKTSGDDSYRLDDCKYIIINTERLVCDMISVTLGFIALVGAVIGDDTTSINRTKRCKYEQASASASPGVLLNYYVITTVDVCTCSIRHKLCIEVQCISMVFDASWMTATTFTTYDLHSSEVIVDVIGAALQ